MYKSPNEIALEQKIKELEKELELATKFETGVTMQFTMILFAMMSGKKGESMAGEAFDKIRDLISERAKYHIMKKEKKESM